MKEPVERLARLTIRLSDGKTGWLELQPRASVSATGQESLVAHVSLFPVEGDSVYSMIGDTEGWQVADIYFEVLARSCMRWDRFAGTRFPVSYYEDETESPPRCTLHHDLEWLHLLLRGVRWPERVGIDCFIRDPPSQRFIHLGGVSQIEDVQRFGAELLEELASAVPSDSEN